MSIAADIRAYAQRSLRSLIFERDTMTRLEHALCESFLTPCDWEEHSLWSIEWRTFALFVAEAISTDGVDAARPFSSANQTAKQNQPASGVKGLGK